MVYIPSYDPTIFLTENVKDECQAVIEIITGGCVWYERGKDGKKVVCKLCKREPDSVEHFLYSCTMFKNDVNDMFNYICKDILIAKFEYMTVEYKWELILTDSGYTDFNMWVPLGCKIASRMFDLLMKKKALSRGD